MQNASKVGPACCHTACHTFYGQEYSLQDLVIQCNMHIDVTMYKKLVRVHLMLAAHTASAGAAEHLQYTLCLSGVPAGLLPHL